MMKPVAATILAGVLALGACAPASNNTATSSAVLPAAAAADANVTARGSFVGKSKHITTGHGSIGRVGKKWVVILENDFVFDGAPDPHVALGKDGYDKNASLALLSSNEGQQVYEIPASLNVANFNEIWIWCDKFSVPLGVAKLTLT